MNQRLEPRYRNEIDGLRAISMLVILIVHLDLPWLPGGFVAVDLFFVISGYVITRLIFGAMLTRTFSIHEFYERRVRRLLPAMSVMLGATLVASAIILPPALFVEAALSVVAVVFFAANFFFWNASDYFAAAAELKPLLHCWTLAVEEQLYLVFPLVLLVLAKRSRQAAKTGVLVLALLSFLLSLYLSYTNRLAAFYLMPSRAWEFLAGAIVALEILPRIDRRWLRELLTTTGLLMICVAMLLIREEYPFPGFYALLPVLGCVFIIYGGHDGESHSARVLGVAPLAYIGRISYSLYLWHWPIIAFANNVTEGELSLQTKMLLAVSAVALGSASYHFIEQPFRRHRKFMSLLSLRSGFVLASLLALAGIVGYFRVMSGSYGQFLKLAQSDIAAVGLKQPCNPLNTAASAVENCSFGDRRASRTFLLWGDSHATSLYPVFDVLGRELGWRGIWITRFGCPPLQGVFRPDGYGYALDGSPITTTCDETAQQVIEFLRHTPVEAVFLVSRWSVWEQGLIVRGRLQKESHFLSDHDTEGTDASASTQVLTRAIRRTFLQLRAASVKVIAVGAAPVLPRPVAEIPAASVALTRQEYELQAAATNATFASLAAEFGDFHWVDIADDFCNAFVCSAYDGGRSLYFDDNHLAPLGALRIADSLRKVMKGLEDTGPTP